MSRKRHIVADERHFVVRTMRMTIRHGQMIEPHSHDWHQLIYASSGVMTVSADRGLWVVPPRWAIWAPAGVRHSIRFCGDSTFATLYLRPSNRRDLPDGSCVISVSPLLKELILRACEEGMLDRRQPAHQAMAVLIVDAFCTQLAPAMALPSPTSAELRQVSACAGERAGTLALARRFGLGVRTLERRFLTETGMSFGQWRRRSRLLEALKRLAQGETVKTTAIEAGYRSASAFVSAFRSAFGTTPARYFGKSGAAASPPSASVSPRGETAGGGVKRGDFAFHRLDRSFHEDDNERRPRRENGSALRAGSIEPAVQRASSSRALITAGNRTVRG